MYNKYVRKQLGLTKQKDINWEAYLTLNFKTGLENMFRPLPLKNPHDDDLFTNIRLTWFTSEQTFFQKALPESLDECWLCIHMSAKPIYIYSIIDSELIVNNREWFISHSKSSCEVALNKTMWKILIGLQKQTLLSSFSTI